jgi:hypothetical protein
VTESQLDCYFVCPVQQTRTLLSNLYLEIDLVGGGDMEKGQTIKRKECVTLSNNPLLLHSHSVSQSVFIELSNQQAVNSNKHTFVVCMCIHFNWKGLHINRRHWQRQSS